MAVASACDGVCWCADKNNNDDFLEISGRLRFFLLSADAKNAVTDRCSPESFPVDTVIVYGRIAIAMAITPKTSTCRRIRPRSPL
jgi:hypothetical protein